MTMSANQAHTGQFDKSWHRPTSGIGPPSTAAAAPEHRSLDDELYSAVLASTSKISSPKLTSVLKI